MNFTHTLFKKLKNSVMRLRPVASGGARGPVPPQFLADQLTLSQPGGAHYAHHITASIPGFENPAAALHMY